MNISRSRTMWLGGAVLSLSLILSACAAPPAAAPAAPAATAVPAEPTSAPTTAPEPTVAPTEAATEAPAPTEAPTAEPTVEATAEMTATEAMTSTMSMTSTEAITGTMPMTSTEAMTSTAAMTATEAMTEAMAGSGMVAVGDSIFGKILVDDKGMSLYMFTKDTAGDGKSTCYEQCAVAWPPLLTSDAGKAGEGVDESLLGTITRTDGTVQVTYKGWPLYYWFRDFAEGDVFGQDVGTVWYVLAPDGEVIKTSGEKIAVAETKLGTVLVDEAGMTLYMFTKDAKNETVCYDQCATNWPPVLTEGAPHPSGEGVDGKLLGMIKRKDGKLQATYNGMPLYYFAKDAAAGDTTGQGVGDVWYVLDGKGEIIK